MILNKINITYISAYFIVVFCCFFLTALVPLSPIYITFFLGVCFLILTGRWKKTPNESMFIYIPFLLFVLFMIINAFLLSSMKIFFIIAYFCLFYIIGDFVLYQINANHMEKVIKNYFYFNLMLMTADLIYRIINARSQVGTVFGNPIYIFYIFKESSLLHEDSNGSGVIILTILSVVFYLKSVYNNRFYKIMYALFFVLLLLTFARASIIAHILLLLFIYFFIRRSIYIKVILISIVIFSCIFILNFFTDKNNFTDGSFLSKITIFERTFDYIKNAGTFQILFGNGELSSPDIIGIGAHNFISALLIESGLISLVLYIWIFVNIAFDTKSGWYIVLFPFFITSLSYTPLATPYIFIATLLIKHTKLKGMVYKQC